MNINLQERLLKTTGASGVKLTSAQGATPVSALVINALEDSVIVVVVDWKNSGPTETLTLDKGQNVFGNFSQITVTSGTVVAY